MDREGDLYSSIVELVNVVRKLRSPSGCSWDRSQTVESLSPFMLEEAYEVLEAVERGDTDTLRKELGDLLLHIVMASEICGEEGRFSLMDVVDGITGKLVRRHPHVFDENVDLSPDEVEQQWETIKAAEKKDEGFFESLPSTMPALQTAWRIQQRASDVGFDWPDAEGARARVMEELKEFDGSVKEGDREEQFSELGDFLFSAVNYVRLLGYEPEALLRASNRKFLRRFTRMEEILREKGAALEDADLETMDAAWEEAKGRG